MRDLKVLLVEDDPRLRRITSDILKTRNYQVICFGTGAEAATYLKSSDAVNILVSDIDLGETPDGLALARLARDLHPSLPILMVSGDSGERFEQEKVEGAAFMPKPFGAFQLFGLIDRLTQEAASAAPHIKPLRP